MQMDQCIGMLSVVTQMDQCICMKNDDTDEEVNRLFRAFVYPFRAKIV